MKNPSMHLVLFQFTEFVCFCFSCVVSNYFGDEISIFKTIEWFLSSDSQHFIPRELFEELRFPDVCTPSTF